MKKDPFSILVIDDEAIIVEALTEILGSEGFVTHHAYTGEEGLMQYRAHQPQIVIVDVRLPDMSGIELLKEIKRSTALTEVIVITGHGDIETAIDALRARASDFVIKPITVNALEVAVERARKRIVLERNLQEYTEHLEDLVQEKVAELKRAHARLEILDQAKQTFLNLIAHELRTPLTAISASKLLPKERLEPDEAQFVDIIIGGYERLNSFVEKALKFVELLSHNTLEPFNTMSFTAIVRSAVQDAAALREKMGIQLLHSFDADASVDVNLREIRFVFDQVIANAVKHSSRGGKIQITIEQNPSTISCFVCDEGKGIDPRHLDSIFDVFSITDLMHHKEGTGLSLAISRLIMSLHGGTIEAESEGPFRGARFIITLPVRTETPPSA